MAGSSNQDWIKDKIIYVFVRERDTWRERWKRECKEKREKVGTSKSRRERKKGREKDRIINKKGERERRYRLEKVKAIEVKQIGKNIKQESVENENFKMVNNK